MSQELNTRFSSDANVILRGIAALSPGTNLFLSEDDLNVFAKCYGVNGHDLKHALPLVRKLVDKEDKTPKSVLDMLSMVCPYKNAFESLYSLLLIAVTLPVTSASCERSFSKMKLVKTYLRNSMSNERLTNIALLSIERVTTDSIDLERFVDEFDYRHDNRRIKLH